MNRLDCGVDRELQGLNEFKHVHGRLGYYASAASHAWRSRLTVEYICQQNFSLVKAIRLLTSIPQCRNRAACVLVPSFFIG